MEESTQALPSSFSLSLRPWPNEQPQADFLPYLIGRIHEQRGHFRNITEKSLIDEIQAEENGEVKEEQNESEDEEGQEQDIERRRKEVYEARAELIRYIGQAQNDTLMAQDFISLLLSQHAPKQAEHSMSPALRQAVPIGSLGFEVTQLPKVPEAEQQDEQLIAKGRKLQSLTSAADFVLARARKLEQEVQRETRYWVQILSITEKGWSVTRLQRDRSSLGVRFGFAESPPEFKDRGFAVLRANDDGDIIIDQGLTSRPKAVRVRIQRGSVTVGTSKNKTLPYTSDLPVEGLIHQARNNLFAEELFWEITREARTLPAQGVSLKGDVVEIPLDPPSHELTSTHEAEDQGKLLIDLLPLDEGIPEAEDGSSDALADAVALSLRILLTHAHQQKFRRRTQPQPPLAERKRFASTPIQKILRPILSHFHHQSAISHLRDSLALILRTLHCARLKTELVVTSTMDYNPLIEKATASSAATAIESLISKLSGPLEATAELTLPTSHTLCLRVLTHLAPPVHGTEYVLHRSKTSDSQIPTSSSFTTLDMLCEQVKYLIAIDIMQLIETENKNAGKWKLARHANELKRTLRDTGKGQTLRVSWEEGKLVLKWTGLGESRKVYRYSWDGGAVQEQKGFWDVLAETGVDPGAGTAM